MTDKVHSARIFQINVSDGGVPKHPIPAGEVTSSGLVGDRQRNRQHHGGPQRALCLYSLDHILALQEEGHPIYPGAIGENLTISGLEWATLEQGVHLRLGDEVLLEITAFAVPCSQIAAAFADGRMVRVSEKLHPGWSRTYARVLQPGRIRPGDPVEII